MERSTIRPIGLAQPLEQPRPSQALAIARSYGMRIRHAPPAGSKAAAGGADDEIVPLELELEIESAAGSGS